MNIPDRKLLPAHIAHHWRVNRRAILISLLVFVVLVIGSLIALLALANNKAAAYRQQVNKHVTDTNSQLLATNKHISELTVGDATGLDNLQKAISAMQKALNEPTPQVSGVFLGGVLSGEYRKSGDTTTKVNEAKTQLLAELAWLGKFIAYNKQLTEAMNKVAASTGSIKSADLAAQEANWKEAAEILKKATPTPEIQATHTQVIDTLGTGSPLWKDLAETYQKADVNGYAKQKIEIDNQFKNLAKQGEAFHELVDTRSKKLNDAFERFLHLQKDL